MDIKRLTWEQLAQADPEQPQRPTMEPLNPSTVAFPNPDPLATAYGDNYFPQVQPFNPTPDWMNTEVFDPDPSNVVSPQELSRRDRPQSSSLPLTPLDILQIISGNQRGTSPTTREFILSTTSQFLDQQFPTVMAPPLPYPLPGTVSAPSSTLQSPATTTADYSSFTHTPELTVMNDSPSLPSGTGSGATSVSVGVGGGGPSSSSGVNPTTTATTTTTAPTPVKRKRGRPRLPRADPPSQAAPPKQSRRLPHTQVERKYREGLNQGMERLRAAIPTLLPSAAAAGPSSSSGGVALASGGGGGGTAVEAGVTMPRPSKATVLASAIEYIRFVEGERTRLEKENERLKELLQRGGKGRKRAKRKGNEVKVEDAEREDEDEHDDDMDVDDVNGEEVLEEESEAEEEDEDEDDDEDNDDDDDDDDEFS